MRSEIVPYAYPRNGKDLCEIGIEKMSITYVQPDDTNHGGEFDTQTLTIETEDAICNREEAEDEKSYYLVLKTDRWAIDSVDDIRMLVDDFTGKLYNTVRNKKPSGNE